MTNIKYRLKKVMAIALLAVGAVILSLTPESYGVLQMSLDDGVNPILIVTDQNLIAPSDGGVGDQNAIEGALVINQIYNDWTINVVTGLAKPALGDALNPHIDLGFVHVSNLFAPGAGAETLTIRLTETDYLNTSAGSGGALSGFTEWGGTTQGIISATSYWDAGNTPFGTANILSDAGPFTPGAFSFSDLMTFNPGVNVPYSLTIELNITHGAGQGRTTSGDFEFTANPVPEPSTYALLGMGLIGLLGYHRKMIKKQAKTA